MLDLNIKIVANDSDDKVLVMAEVEERMLMAVGGVGKGGGGGEDAEDEEKEYSLGTSDSSSVVNDDEFPASAGDENTYTATAAYSSVFDVFKKDKEVANPLTESELVTRQFFPFPGGGVSELRPTPVAPVAAVRSTQWLNLSFSGGSSRGSGVELRPPREFRELKPQQVRKSRRGPRSRSSQYRGVTFYRRTGRWESHIWDCGKQVYLGGFDTAYAAARAYDRAAIKFRGVNADINFSIGDYEEDMKQIGNLTKEEFVQVLRRRSTGAYRSGSKLRGAGLPQCAGQWDARMGDFIGNKGLENSLPQYNQQAAIANLEHGYQNPDIALEATSGGSGGKALYLDLGIAPPSEGVSKSIKIAGNYCNRESPLVVSSSNGSSVPNNNKLIPAWPDTYPFLLSSPEGGSVDKRRAEARTSSTVGWRLAPVNGEPNKGSSHLW
ncbi:hypothetical protein SAY87_006084 [Trapa incisa]|uniref:AP2/ERF domain-containing protein n=1 Tax=Trapa incisa TaxID=236973 RepID=A0AAN7Q7M1_9MYRT|nr:hypothetical protein SAY87_006084 [Trapa incisa]